MEKFSDKLAKTKESRHLAKGGPLHWGGFSNLKSTRERVELTN